MDIRDTAFDPYAELARFRASCGAGAAALGGEAVFIGTMRNHNEGDRVVAMELEHYPEMTRRYLQRIADEARERFGAAEVFALHRVGRVVPGETIVVVAALAAHRGPALGACSYLIEQLKLRAPFWKKETLADGSTRWVDRNTPRTPDATGHAA